MQWEKKRVLLTVKAYPEVSKTYGETVCLAGITEENEFIRLYPVPFELFRSSRLPKYTWIEVECAKTQDLLGRKESHKIRTDSSNYGIRVVDQSLVRAKGRAPWAERNKVVLPLLSPSLEDLQKRLDSDRTSLGLVKASELLDFHIRQPLSELEKKIEEERSAHVQTTLFGGSRTKLQKIPHNFYYRFRCSPSCPIVHDMSFEDWEVFQSFLAWKDIYPDSQTLWLKMKQKFYDEFREKNLHFFVGTHYRWPSWMIVGAYYPPK